MKKQIHKISTAVQEDIADLKTFRAMPTSHLAMIDPFLFLNHHGPQVYPPHNSGLPFGPHPHRGFETVTFIIEGDIAHKDNAGHESVIKAGGVQWMTTGRGIIHEEVSSEEFKDNGGPLEILQLWVNLPSHLKMTKPEYTGLQEEMIPNLKTSQYEVSVVSGNFKEIKGPFKTLIDLTCLLIEIESDKNFEMKIPSTHNIFFYIIQGSISVNDTDATERQTVEFNNQNEEILIKTKTQSKILLCHAPPLNEPVVSYGPFVMNTREEIQQAIKDFQDGKF